MTEKEYKTMFEEIAGNTEADKTIEIGWAQEQLTLLNVTLQRNIAAAGLYKYLLDEANLKNIKVETQRVRNCIGYLKDRIKVLSGQ